MIAALKPYPAYRDSGVTWLGDVPEHWDVRQLGRFGALSKGNGGTKEDELPDGVPCVRYGDIYMKHQFFVEKSRACVSPEAARDYTPILYGDVLFAGSGETIDEIGKSVVNLMQSGACCGGDIIIFRPSIKVDARYMGYASDCRQAVVQKSRMGRGITVMHLYGDQLKYLWVALPPVPEQAAIARFLDHTGWRIGQCIRAKKNLVNLLEEYKQVFINHSVTGRIDARTGHPYASYKPSGVEWLDEVPEHWDVVRSRRLFAARGELARSGDQQLSSTQAYGVIPQSDFEQKIGRRVVKLSMHFEKRKHVEQDDFVISMRSFQGGLERAWASGAIRSSYVVLKPSPAVDVGFFSYLLKSRGYIGALRATAGFIRDGQDLTYDDFCCVDLPLVPVGEQREIADAIAEIVSRVDATIATDRNEIELLTELRSRLVADVLDGKIDVREATAGLPCDACDSEFVDDEDECLEEAEVDDIDQIETHLEEIEASAEEVEA